MSRALSQPMGRNQVVTVNTGAPARPVGEAEARENAARYQEEKPLIPPSPRSASAQTPPQGVFGDIGQELSNSQRADMEPRFGRDFSNVRVHPNSEEAEAMGARAFTYGDDIAFAPGESAGGALLAHELTHQAQQQDSGKPQVQMDPKEGKRGIGAEPPGDAFERAEKPGAEDDAVLFQFNDATLSGAGLAMLKKLAQAQKNPVVVEVHGYASNEGEDEYNINLSAHRAAAIKAALTELLPAGSTVKLFAHGKTENFGPAENNRRAGFKLTPVPAAPPDKKTDDDWSLDPSGDAPKKDPKVDPTKPVVSLVPPIILGPGPVLPPSLLYLPPLGQRSDVDWLSMRNKWAAYGLYLDPKTAGDIDDYASMQFRASTNFFSLFMHPLDAAAIADKLMPIALGVGTSAYLSNNFPNWWDLTQRELDAQYPDATKIPQVPVNSVVDFIYQKASGNDKGSLFSF